MKLQLLAAGVGVALLGLTGCASGGTEPAPVAAPTTPAPSTTAPDTDWSWEDEEDDYEYSYEPEYTCSNIKDDVTDMAERQHTWGSLLVGIKSAKTIKDNQPTSKKNGAVLVCEGTGIVSGGDNQKIEYGLKNEGGDTYVYYEGK